MIKRCYPLHPCSFTASAIKQHLGGSKKQHLGANKQHLGLIWVIYSSDLGHSIGTFLYPRTVETEETVETIETVETEETVETVKTV